MAKIDLKKKAIELRKNSMSYSQIKEQINVSKSTLSIWLKDLPLSNETINSLRSKSVIRIEKFRNTMAKKQVDKFALAYKKAEIDIGNLDDRDIFIAGLYLYWGEGSKTNPNSIVLTNTNPNMLIFYFKWLKAIGADVNKIKINLHLYSNMNIESEIDYWSKVLNIPKKQFRRPYIKSRTSDMITYKKFFNHGTCSVVYSSRALADYVYACLKKLQETSLGARTRNRT